MNDQYEVLNPWAEVYPIPLKGISPRLNDFTNKRIGLFLNNKIAAEPTSKIVEGNLREKFPTVSFSRFVRVPNVSVAETADKAKYEEWIKSVDAIIFSVAD